MNGSNPRSTASLMGHPIHPSLVPFPIVFFISALVTDVLHCLNGAPVWVPASLWLLCAGLIGAALAAIVGLIDFLGDPRIRALTDAKLHVAGNVLVVVIELVNFLIRLHPGHQGGTPGLILSIVAVLILGFTGWKGGELVFRHRVGVQPGDTLG